MTPTYADVLAAGERMDGLIRRTPIFSSATLNREFGREVHFKCENFQKVGAFKARGALNAVLNLSINTAAVVTHSSGNHGAALAWAASEADLKSFVICPTNASRFKRDAILRYGAQIVDCGPTLNHRETALQAFLQENQATFVHPYDDQDIVAGQGTATVELLNEVPDIAEIWVPVGGGGLAAGTVVGANGRCKVVGCEPELARDAHDSLAAGKRMPALPPESIADGLLTSLGEINFDILRQQQTEIHLVSEEEIRAATTLIWRVLKIVIEPSSAVPVAAALKNKVSSTSPIAIILSGGNVVPILNV